MPGGGGPLPPPPGLPTPPCPAPEAALGLALEQLALLGLRGEEEEEEEEAAARKAAHLGESIPAAAAAARDAGVALDHLAFPGAPPGGGGWRQHHHHHHPRRRQGGGGGGAGDPRGNPLPGPPKRSVNMTLCVPVPSSEHVAEIVGRQGCKIKALRAKTNTYIKTPVRGEEPVFIVTGRQEDVEMAKWEILSAAEHFSMIRATRNKLNGVAGSALGPPNLPGQTTIQVRVPYRVVGLVVGPKGGTIKRIQQQTHTYIVTPSREKEPVFEVTGMPENVDRAREEIEAHITTRTGAFVETDTDNDFHANGKDVCLDFLGRGPSRLWSRAPNPNRRTHSGLRNGPLGSMGPAPSATELYFEGTPRTHFGSGKSLPFGEPPAAVLASDNGNFGFDVLALDLTTPDTVWSPFESPANLPQAFGSSFFSSQRRHSNSSGTTTPQHSPMLPEGGTVLEHPLARRIQSDPVSTLPWLSSQDSLSSFSNSTGYSSSSSLPGSVSGNSGSPTESTGSEGPCKNSRECMVCFESEVIAALVPCGHNLFCLQCAWHICKRPAPECPACHMPATQVIPIFS